MKEMIVFVKQIIFNQVNIFITLYLDNRWLQDSWSIIQNFFLIELTIFSHVPYIMNHPVGIYVCTSICGLKPKSIIKIVCVHIDLCKLEYF